MRQKFSTSYYRQNIRRIGISTSSSTSNWIVVDRVMPINAAKVALILLFFDPRDESSMLTEVVWQPQKTPSFWNFCYPKDRSTSSSREMNFSSGKKKSSLLLISSRVWKRQKGAIVFLAARQEFYPQLSQKTEQFAGAALNALDSAICIRLLNGSDHFLLSTHRWW